MNSAIVGVLGLVWFAAAYRIFGRMIEKKLISPNDAQATPARTINDGVDFCPSRPMVLFGHHFSSIAGAGPIIGPVIAAHAFGFLPSLLWILLGSVLIGAVHDYTTLMVSIRHGGRSIPDIAKELVDGKTRVLFQVFVLVALIFINAVFAIAAAQSFVADGRIVVPAVGLIPLAMLFGWLVNRRGVSMLPAGLGALALLVMLFYVGMRVSVVLPVGKEAAMQIWIGLLLIYGATAAILPVWLLLQPRDFIASWILAAGMAVGFVGLFVTHPKITAPMSVGLVSPTQGPMWPMLFILIACGAVSGFHSLVSSGTTAKQLAKESDGKAVGFGAMITEGALALLALLCVTAGLAYDADGGVPNLSGFLANGGNAIGAFAAGFGTITQPFLGAAGALFGMMMLNAFVLTTLDTSVRLARFITVELLGPVGDIFNNRYVATIVPLLASYALAATGSQTSLWPMFGAANQLIAALAMIVVTVYFARQKKPTLFTLLPAIFMWMTTVGALAWKGIADFRDGKVGLSVAAALLLVLAIFVGFRSVRAIRRPVPAA